MGGSACKKWTQKQIFIAVTAFAVASVLVVLFTLFITFDYMILSGMKEKQREEELATARGTFRGSIQLNLNRLFNKVL